MARKPKTDEGVMIPRNPEKDELATEVDKLAKTMLDIKDEDSKEYQEASSKLEKANLKLYAVQQEQANNVNPVMGFLRKTVLTPAQFKYQKIRNKITEQYHKHIVKGKFFKTLGTHLKKIAEQTGSFLWKFLKGLMLLAIFDPKGKFLTSIIGFLVKAITWVIKAITKQLPVIIKAMVNILFNVLPKALNQLIDGIFSSLENMFTSWMKEFPEDSVMHDILNVARKLFAKDGPIAGFLSLVADIAPFILVAVGAIKLYTIAMGAFNAMSTFITANPITAIIIGIVLAFVALWKWKDKIAGFFESIFEWFSNLGALGKVFIAVLAKIFWPITLVIGAIYGLVKLFQSFADIGVVETFKLIWEKIKEGFLAMFTGKFWKKALKIFLNLLGFLLKFGFKLLKKVFWDLPKFLLGVMVDGLEMMGITFPKKLGELILSAFEPIKGFFNDVIIWFKTIANVGLGNYLWASDEKREQAKKATRAIEAVEEIREKGGKIPEELAKYVTAGKGGVDFEALMEKMGKMDINVVESKVNAIEKRAEETSAKVKSPAKEVKIVKKGGRRK